MTYCWIAVVLGAFSVPLFGKDAAHWALFHLSYWVMALVLGAFLWAAVRLARSAPISEYRKPLTVFLITSAVALGFIFLQNPFQMKINSDEACILAVANSFSINQQPHTITEAKYYYDAFHPINLEVPMRPMLFSFLVHLSQKFVGMNLNSLFVTNGVIGFFYLFLTQLFFFIATRSFLMAVTGGFLLYSLPVFQIYMTSGGFDLASSFFLALSLWFGTRFIRNESNENRSLFLLSLCLFSHVRYENPLIGGVLGLYVLTQIQGRVALLMCWEFFLTAASISLHFWQRFITTDLLNDINGKPVIGWINFQENGLALLKGLIRFDLPYNTVFVALLLPLLLVLIFHKRFNSNRKLWGLVILGIVLPTLVNVFTQGGEMTHPASVRYFFPLTIGGVLLVPWMCFYLFKLRAVQVTVIAAINWLVFSLSPTHYDYLNTLVLNRDINRLMEFVKSVNDKRILIIYDRPVQFAALGYGSISMSRGKNEFELIRSELKNGLYDHVYVFEESTYSQQGNRWSNFGNGFKELSHFQQQGDHAIFISELTDP